MRSLFPWPTFPFNLEPPIARSISLQFILQGLIDSFDELEKMKATTPYLLQGANLSEEIVCIMKDIEKFLLFSLENPIEQKVSHLDKLCFYCEILLQASHVKDSEIPAIWEEMRRYIVDMKAKLTTWKKSHSLYTLDQMLRNLYDLLIHLDQELCHFFQALTPFLKEARSDENVLVFLIENKDKFNSYLGPRAIEELLVSFFPAGHDQLRAVIHEGYTRRGFSAFLEKVEPLIDAIQWEMPACHPATTH